VTNVTTRKPFVVGVLVSALVLLVASIAFAMTGADDRRWSAARYGPGMMGYGPARGGGEPVKDIAQARRRAERFADRLDLRVGEVMAFADNYYAELEEPDGDLATEVLIDPRTGATWTEPGPAMMWNTRYGMMRGGGDSRNGPMMGAQGAGGMMGQGADPNGGGGPRSGSSRSSVSAAEAEQIAGRWLADSNSGLTVQTADAFPGYYTLHTMRGEAIAGMLSVNATTGAVWEHWWHGRFVTMTE